VITVPQVEASRPEALTDAAARLGSSAVAIGQHAAEQQAMFEKLSASWRGTASDAAMAKAAPTLAQMRSLQCSLQHVQSVIQRGASELTQMRAGVLDAVDRLHEQGWQVTPDGTVSVRPGSPLGQFARISAVNAMRVSQLATANSAVVKTLLGHFDTKDRELDGKIRDALTGLKPDERRRNGVQMVGNRFGMPEKGGEGDAEVLPAQDAVPNGIPPAGRWDGPPPAGEVKGTGYWAVDTSRPSGSSTPLPAPAPYESGPPCATDAVLTGPPSGVLTVGGDSPQKEDANGFDLQNTYRFRVAGEEFRGVTKMVEIDGKWYQAQWQSYQYEMNKIPVVQGSGDLGGLTLPVMSEANEWTPVTLGQIIRESEQHPGGPLYIPDAKGSSVQVIGGQLITDAPVVPVMRSGG
jgi:uncharacterized protein YukE